jgi:murein DD-endopeptidase MepM/ murein hydrolase activator NlpD
LCSPLAGISLAELPQLMTGDKFVPPLPGRDDGHHGIDFAFYRHGSLTTMLGLPVQAILPGHVAAVINNLKPYGFAIIIETSLQGLSFLTAGTINLPTPAPTVLPDPRLTCPTPFAQPWLTASHRSLYYLYAHLNRLPAFKVGDEVACGQQVGEVGTSGNSVNPHLHLETRLGPAGVTFLGLGHYDTRTTEEERANYCIWRVSGWFQMFDPMTILAALPTAAGSK